MTSTSSTIPHGDDDLLRELRAPQGRPLLPTGGAVITGDPLLGDWQSADVLIGGTVIVGIGPGLLTAAGDDNMIVIDCAGTLVLPAVADFTAPRAGATLTPGQSADIAVLRLTDAPGTPAGAIPARGTTHTPTTTVKSHPRIVEYDSRGAWQIFQAASQPSTF
ncbi:hypothetical protein [Embleya hyalina]|uniref:Uncharacterized protein n=1 Tax=Embleya hyalina TaxID=516124 RepID=A0A401Z1C9_9ACTN|nr:hypothetical protein [Embleya hyalina]GCE00665.1 hypothetical protein EHYA_08391 [Embleya hyalina]